MTAQPALDLPEEWRAIDKAPGYFISSRGRVRSHRRGAPPEGRLIRLTVTRGGYHIVRICQDGKWRTRLVHQLVLEAFVGPRGDRPETRHLNDVKTDNRVENLAWGSHRENTLDRVRNGIHHWSSRTACNYGHEFTPENTVWRDSGRRSRRCRECTRARNRAYKARRRALATELP